jgi:glycosyltransferase involved in cell wall biosynthesis
MPDFNSGSCLERDTDFSCLTNYALVSSDHDMTDAPNSRIFQRKKTEEQPFVCLFARFLAQRYDVPSVVNFFKGEAVCQNRGFFDSISEMLTAVRRGQISYVKGILSGRVSRVVCRDRWKAVSGYRPDKVVIVCQNLEDLTVSERELALNELRLEMETAPVSLVTWRTALPSLKTLKISNPKDLNRILIENDLNVSFTGYAYDTLKNLRKDVLVSVVLNNNQKFPANSESLEKFRVVAIIAAYNEEDIIESSVRKLVNQGILVYAIDNWSTDSTYKILQEMFEKGLILGYERYPTNGPLDFLDWKGLLARKEELSLELEADWFIHHDVDEVRVSPWRSKSLKEAIYMVDQMGFNAIDHTQITFVPIDNGFKADLDFESYFNHYRQRMGQRSKLNSWKKTNLRPNLTESGGHEVIFDGRKVFPYNFLIKHYPIRSQEHGERKIFGERQPRSMQEKRKMKWHVHYYRYGEGHSFVSNEQDLLLFNPDTFEEQYLIERLSGTGIIT